MSATTPILIPSSPPPPSIMWAASPSSVSSFPPTPMSSLSRCLSSVDSPRSVDTSQSPHTPPRRLHQDIPPLTPDSWTPEWSPDYGPPPSIQPPRTKRTYITLSPDEDTPLGPIHTTKKRKLVIGDPGINIFAIPAAASDCPVIIANKLGYELPEAYYCTRRNISSKRKCDAVSKSPAPARHKKRKRGGEEEDDLSFQQRAKKPLVPGIFGDLWPKLRTPRPVSTARPAVTTKRGSSAVQGERGGRKRARFDGVRWCERWLAQNKS